MSEFKTSFRESYFKLNEMQKYELRKEVLKGLGRGNATRAAFYYHLKGAAKTMTPERHRLIVRAFERFGINRDNPWCI